MPTVADYMDSHCEWLDTYVNRGFEATFLTIMFNPLPGSEETKKQLMEQAIFGCYKKAVKAMFRRPRSVDMPDLPLWIVCHDWPVPKKGHKINRDHLVNIVINDGLHLHSLSLTPPRTRLGGRSLELHLDDNQFVYAPRNGTINRILADTVRPENMERAARYVMKSMERYRIGVGDVIVFPKSHSEFTQLRPGQTPRDGVVEILHRRMAERILR